jgi:DNA replication factor GINS
MVEAIEQNRGHVLDVVSGETHAGTVGDGETTTETGVDAADIMGGSGTDTVSELKPDEASESEPSESAEPPESAAPERPPEEALSAMEHAETETDSGTADVARKTVRITDEVGEIFGVDQREYDLSTDDVVTLPADNADPLVERDAAEPIE